MKMLGHFLPETHPKQCLNICERHIHKDGIDSVIPGGNEFLLVISNDDLPIAVLDTTVIHAQAILAAAS